jgi:acyltransferase
LTAATVDSETVAQIPLSAGVGCACVVFVLAGREFKKVRFRIQRPLITGLLLLLGCSAVILAGWSTYLDMKQALLGIPVITVVIAIAICSALVLIAEAVIPALGARVNTAVSTLASCGFMVVLTHAVVLVELTKLNVPPWLILASCLAGTWIPALLILRTRLAPYLLGSPWSAPRTAKPHSTVDASDSPDDDLTPIRQS